MPAVTYTIPGLYITEHSVNVPLNWTDDTDSRSITVFAREIVAPAKRHQDLPILLFLQGGPGGKSPRPTGPSGWLQTALATHRVVLLDQRGTGRSSPVQASQISSVGTPSAQAEYLSHFRADSIVADAEHIRRTVYGGRKWATLGQSYGGFLTMTYLSTAPEGLTGCYVTGGLPGLSADASEVYRRLYPRVLERNIRFRQRYPHDEVVLNRVADRIAAGGVRLPHGDELTVERFQLLGLGLGMAAGAEQLHWLLDEAFAGDELTDCFLAEVDRLTSYWTDPLYAVMHESIYSQGAPTGWAAHTLRPVDFDPGKRPINFTGELMYPWMFDQISSLKPFQAAAELLAEYDSWAPLYDLNVLAENEVPVEAVIYHNDMYVDAGLSLETAAALGHCHPWVTNEYEHDGLRLGDVFARLRERMEARGGERLDM